MPPAPTKSEPSDAAPPATVPTVPSVPRRRLTLLVAVAAVVLIADVISKQLVVAHLSNRAPLDVIPKVLDLELTRNPGAAFGFAAGATVIFSVVAAAVVVFIARASRRLGSVGWASAARWETWQTGFSGIQARCAAMSSTGFTCTTGRCSTWPTPPS
jgi:signal peptidase II